MDFPLILNINERILTPIMFHSGVHPNPFGNHPPNFTPALPRNTAIVRQRVAVRFLIGLFPYAIKSDRWWRSVFSYGKSDREYSEWVEGMGSGWFWVEFWDG
jgi:hypothetical protein